MFFPQGFPRGVLNQHVVYVRIFSVSNEDQNGGQLSFNLKFADGRTESVHISDSVDRRMALEDSDFPVWIEGKFSSNSTGIGHAISLQV